jgi:hypothetical protein
MQRTEEYLIEAADQLQRTAQAIRDAAGKLENIGNALLAEAVRLDTFRDRSRRAPDGSHEN